MKYPLCVCVEGGMKADEWFGGWEVELVQFLTTDNLNSSMALIFVILAPKSLAVHPKGYVYTNTMQLFSF
jgi:hypothetical protein